MRLPAWLERFFPQPPRSRPLLGPRFEARCAWPGCKAGLSYAYGEGLFLKYTSRSGASRVKRTVDGPWACSGHAYAVGGGWRP